MCGFADGVNCPRSFLAAGALRGRPRRDQLGGTGEAEGLGAGKHEPRGHPIRDTELEAELPSVRAGGGELHCKVTTAGKLSEVLGITAAFRAA